jgi:hypothetical protein
LKDGTASEMSIRNGFWEVETKPITQKMFSHNIKQPLLTGKHSQTGESLLIPIKSISTIET